MRLGWAGVNGVLPPPQLHHIQTTSAKHQHAEGDGCAHGERVAGGWLVALGVEVGAELYDPADGGRARCGRLRADN